MRKNPALGLDVAHHIKFSTHEIMAIFSSLAIDGTDNCGSFAGFIFLYTDYGDDGGSKGLSAAEVVALITEGSAQWHEDIAGRLDK